MKLITIALLSAAAGAGALAAPTPRGPEPLVPAASWAPADTADSLWRRGRIAIAEESWSEAARTFERIADRFPQSAYAGDALYWQAFALQRLGSSSDLRRGVRALELQKEKYPKATTLVSGEAGSLLTRMTGRLARTGDADAAAAIAELAASAAQIGVGVVSEVMPMVAAELERARPEIEREMAAARAELAQARASMRGGRGSEIPAECEGVIGEERIEALNALLQMSSDQALPILRKVLERRDRCSEVLRRKAVFMVSQKRGDEAADILVNVAKTDPDRETREQAVFWLSSTNSDRAAEVLEQILREDQDPEMQKRAIFSLGQSRTERSRRVLREFVRRQDASEDARADAIFWMGQGRDPENAAFLRELFPTLRSRELREKVIFSLSQSRSAENSRWLLGVAKDRALDAETRKQALFWAGQSGVAVKDLAEIYDAGGDDRELRNQVIFVLSQRRRDEAAMDKLFDIAQREPDAELRKQAIFWLGQSKDPRASKLLDDIINKPFE